MQGVRSIQAFRGIWREWAIGGIRPDGQYTSVFMMYSIFVNITVTFYLPMSFICKIFQEEDMQVILQLSSMTLTMVAFSLKHFVVLFSKRNRSILQVLQKLDQGVQSEEEIQCIQSSVKFCRRLLIAYNGLFYTSFVGYVVTSLRYKRQLIFPTWFPFDLSVDENFWAAYAYQVFALTISVSQNVAHDVYPPVYISVLTAHIKALGLRVSKIGWDVGTGSQKTFSQLVACVEHYSDILRLFHEVDALVKLTSFIQIFITAFVLCLGAVNLIFFTTELPQMVAITAYLAAIILEVFPVCYYMNRMTECNAVLTESVYACNWIDQELKFKKAIILFIQETQKEIVMFAGNIIRVNLQTFLKILKLSFSMFTLLNKLKK